MRIFYLFTLLATQALLGSGCGPARVAAGLPAATQALEQAAALNPGAALEETGPKEATAVVESADPSGLAGCPVTQHPQPAFVPPEPWPAAPPGEDQFWFGAPGLWTALPESGSWRQLVLGEKFWWWSQEFDVQEDSTPDLTVTARRLDGEAPDYQNSGATNGYHSSFNWAMLQGVTLPTPGCWEFTGEYEGHSLTLVVWVPPE